MVILLPKDIRQSLDHSFWWLFLKRLLLNIQTAKIKIPSDVGRTILLWPWWRKHGGGWKQSWRQNLLQQPRGKVVKVKGPTSETWKRWSWQRAFPIRSTRSPKFHALVALFFQNSIIFPFYLLMHLLKCPKSQRVRQDMGPHFTFKVLHWVRSWLTSDQALFQNGRAGQEPAHTAPPSIWFSNYCIIISLISSHRRL